MRTSVLIDDSVHKKSSELYLTNENKSNNNFSYMVGSCITLVDDFIECGKYKISQGYLTENEVEFLIDCIRGNTFDAYTDNPSSFVFFCTLRKKEGVFEKLCNEHKVDFNTEFRKKIKDLDYCILLALISMANERAIKGDG